MTLEQAKQRAILVSIINACVQHVCKHTGKDIYYVSDWYDYNVVVSYENGKEL